MATIPTPVAMTVLSLVSIHVLMYAMVNAFSNVIPNLNQFYMPGLMTAPMVVIGLLLMKSMYAKRAWNMAILTASTALLLVL